MEAWQEIDRTLRDLARRRAALDVEEARWLRAAEDEEMYWRFGCASLVEYLEQVLGYTPKVAVERIRVANALDELPVVEAALGDGKLLFSAVRELTRVAVPETEAAWVAAAIGKRVHQVERLVSGRKPGDLPSDPRDPDLETMILRLELARATVALYRQVHRLLEDEAGEPMNENDVHAAMCRTILAGTAANAETQGRAPHQVVLHVCEKCSAGQQIAGGVAFDVHANSVARALCDAQHIGRVDGDAPERAGQNIPPAIRRMVLLRDHHRCRVPWCRSARYLHIHHLDGRHVDDCHAPEKLVSLCGFHHTEHHDGRLVIRGESASALMFERVSLKEPIDMSLLPPCLNHARPHTGVQ